MVSRRACRRIGSFAPLAATDVLSRPGEPSPGDVAMLPGDAGQPGALARPHARAAVTLGPVP
jgi:hypothetical protein